MPKHKQTAEDGHPSFAELSREGDGRRALFDSTRQGSPERSGSKHTSGDRDGKRRRVDKESSRAETPPPSRRDRHRRIVHDDDPAERAASPTLAQDASVDMLRSSNQPDSTPSLFDVAANQAPTESRVTETPSQSAADVLLRSMDVPLAAPLSPMTPQQIQAAMETSHILFPSPSVVDLPAVNATPPVADVPRVLFPSSSVVDPPPVTAPPVVDVPRVLPPPLVMNKASAGQPRHLDEVRARLDTATRALDEEQRRIDQRRAIIAGYSGLLDDIARAGTTVPVTVGTNPVPIGIDAAVTGLCAATFYFSFFVCFF